MLYFLPTQRRVGFTLIELLVVISIIALLIGILLPVLGAVRQSARATASLSNVRQWGLGNAMAADLDDGRLPWVGDSDADSVTYDAFGVGAINPAVDLDSRGRRKMDYWWAHVVPPLVGQPSYRELGQVREDVPLPGDGTIFVDPAAEEPEEPLDSLNKTIGDEIPYTETIFGNTLHWYFNYVPNSAMLLSLNADASGNPDKSFPKLMNQDWIPETSSTITMLELRSTNRELFNVDPDQRFFIGKKELHRGKANWKRFAARHDGGSHLLFADGHGSYFKYEEVVTHADGDRNSYTEGDYVDPSVAYGRNQPGLIWDPLGAATD